MKENVLIKSIKYLMLTHLCETNDASHVIRVAVAKPSTSSWVVEELLLLFGDISLLSLPFKKNWWIYPSFKLRHDRDRENPFVLKRLDFNNNTTNKKDATETNMGARE